MNLRRTAAICGMIINAALSSQAVAGAIVPPVEAFQSATEPLGATRTLNGTSVICLGRMTTQKEHPSVPFRIVVPLEQIDTATKQGFTRIDCAGLEKKLAGYKRMVCEMAASGNDAVQARLKSVIGFEPLKLCSSVKAVTLENDK